MPHTNLGIEYLLLGLLMLLSLIAAVGAWRQPKSLTREQAEDLLQALEARSNEASATARREQDAALDGLRTDVTGSMRNLAELLDSTVRELRSILTQASEQQHENLRRNLGDISLNMTAALTEARKSQDAGIEKVEGTLQQVRADVDRASSEVRTSIVELARQHNEAKAQSAIQLCEALISSLGTLRNTIASQIADNRPAEMITSEAGTEDRSQD